MTNPLCSLSGSVLLVLCVLQRLPILPELALVEFLLQPMVLLSVQEHASHDPAEPPDHRDASSAGLGFLLPAHLESCADPLGNAV